MQHIKHVFFDLDHTLWDFESNSKLAFQQIFNKHQMQIAIPAFLDIYRPINYHYWKLFREEKVTKKALKKGRLKDAFTAFNYSINDDLINTLAEDYLEALSNHNKLFNNAIEVLEYLSQKYTLHIITNGFSEVQHKKMKNSKISHFFTVVIDSEMVGVKKPNPKIFHEALSKANAVPSNSIMIGDNLEADVYGAINIGMQAIYCNFIDAKKQLAVQQITALEQLKHIL